MRGFLQPGLRKAPNEAQSKFASLSRNRRTKLAQAASVTLVKADQWARGDQVPSDVASALEKALSSFTAKKPKK
jgi:hypothetical protein